MTRRIPRYLALVLIAVCACGVRGSCAWTLFRILRNPDAAPEAPFAIRTATRTIETGELAGDQILSIDGKPFRGFRQYKAAVFGKKPGEKLLLVLSEPSGRAVEKYVAVPSQRLNFRGWKQIVPALIADVPIPLAFIALGVFAVGVRPFDPNAWLLLPVLLGFTEISSRDYGVQGLFVQCWSSATTGLMPLFLMLFGISFPEPTPWEARRWWLKYLAVAPCALVPLAATSLGILWEFEVSAALRFWPLSTALSLLQTGIEIPAILMFFIFIALKSRLAASADSRRRLRILMWGVPAAFAFPPIFPLTLTYVVLVGRAMDLRSMVRSGLQWGITNGGLWLLRAAMVGLAVYGWRQRWPLADFAWLGLGIVVARKRIAAGAAEWLDRRLFRESYEADRALADLAKEVLPLETTATRISATLHVTDLVILVREGDVFTPKYSTRPGEPMSVDAAGPVARALHARDAVLLVDFDKPAPWLRELTAEELQALDHMRTELLLPLISRGQMAGIMSLGAKLSEAPYSDREIRLLRIVALQMSMAL